MKRMPLKTLPEWVPEVGTTVEVTPYLTPFIFNTKKASHRAKVTSVGESDEYGIYWIKLEDFCHEIYLSEKKEKGWVKDNSWLSEIRIAF